MPARFDFDLVVGDSYPPGDGAKFTVTLSTGPDLDNLSPYDLSSAVIGAELSAVKGGDSIVTFETEILNQVTNEGQFTWRIPASETADLTPGRRPWRLFITWADTDSKTTILEGIVSVSYAH